MAGEFELQSEAVRQTVYVVEPDTVDSTAADRIRHGLRSVTVSWRECLAGPELRLVEYASVFKEQDVPVPGRHLLLLIARLAEILDEREYIVYPPAVPEPEDNND